MAGKQSTPPTSTLAPAAPAAPAAQQAVASAAQAAPDGKAAEAPEATARVQAPDTALLSTELLLELLAARAGLTAEALGLALLAASRGEAPQPQAADAADAAMPTLDAAAVAKLVKREVTLRAPGAQPRTQLVPVHADEVLAWRDYGSHVVVVTIDGQKFSSASAH